MPSRSHGMSGSRIYYVWSEMVRRCTNPRNVSYHNYGGRGIRVCERWRNFENFMADMGQPPPSMTLERDDNDGHYEPGNCSWATRRAQANNFRRNVVIPHDGKTQTLAEWSHELNLSYKALQFRHAIGEEPPVLFRPVKERAKPQRRAVLA